MHGGLWEKIVVMVSLGVCEEKENNQMQVAQELSHWHFPASGFVAAAMSL